MEHRGGTRTMRGCGCTWSRPGGSPARTGSSVGISIAHNDEEYMACFDEARQFDEKLSLEFLEMYGADGNYFYYQGIPDEYQFKPYARSDKRQFAINVSGDNLLDVWAFALELRKAIDRAVI